MKIRITLLLLVLSLSQVFATNHIVQFGGSIGMAYSPSQINANVGDTITWQGDFSFHPLISISVPSGASSFSNSTGSSFSYVIAFEGTYNFQCSVHGFNGQIIAAGASGINSPSGEKEEINIFPTVTKGFLKITLPQGNENCFLEIRNAVGQPIMKVNLMANATNTVDLSGLYNGLYFVAIRTETELVKVVRVIKE
ncbi:MAG TPA: hypothetical protein DCQ93_00640 [Bacteroidetes bacterium]|nr:hypothetical protein [Bacteroidota bacterium]